MSPPATLSAARRAMWARGAAHLDRMRREAEAFTRGGLVAVRAVTHEPLHAFDDDEPAEIGAAA